MMFYTAYKRPEKVFEYNSGEKIVERAGYIPAVKQIENLILAGERLRLARLEEFDSYLYEDEDIPLDPTRRADFDLADASMMAQELRAKKAEAMMLQKGKKKSAYAEISEEKDVPEKKSEASESKSES